MDSPDQELTRRVQVLIDWLNKHVPAVQWPEERFRRKFAQRSIIEIANDQDTSYIGACFDYTSLASNYLATYLDDQHQIGVELLSNGDKHNNSHGIHTYLSFTHQREGHTLDFSDRTNVYLYKCSYQNAQPHVTSRQTFLLPTPIDPRKNLFENYSDYLTTIHFSLDDYLQHVTKYNNDPETYQRYLSEIAGQEELTLKPYRPTNAPKPI